MSSNHNEPSEPDDIIIHPKADLISLPEGGSPALSEIISRSLAHIQTRKTLAAPERRDGEEQEFEIAPGVKVAMCWIPPGEFLMGSPKDEVGRVCYENETQHRVKLTQGFWLGKYQVTQEQWETVMGSNPSRFKGPNLPVETVSWNDISEPGGFMEKVNGFATAGGIFSLPTEAQWEYACRAGTSTALNNGANLTAKARVCRNLDEVAWYAYNSSGITHPGGQKKSNAWGLHDMHGNVFEWCSDWHGAYQVGAEVDPRGPDSGSYRVFRGGGWIYIAGFCRAAARPNCGPGSHPSIGFRLARSSVPKTRSSDNGRSSSMVQVANAVHVVTSKTLNRLHRIGDHELCWPDYQLVCIWAELLHVLPVEVMMILLEPDPWSRLMSRPTTSLFAGHFVSLAADRRLRGIMGLPAIKGLLIEYLTLCDLNLYVLDLLPVPNLKGLWCHSNRLTDLDLSPVPSLNVLSCYLNQLTELDLSPVPNLTRLECDGNQLTELDLSWVPNLKNLSSCGTQITEFDLSPITNLTDFGCRGNQLTFLDLSSVPELTNLDCSMNQLTDLDLSVIPNLKVLNCSENELANLDLSQVPNLTELRCAENQLTDLDLSHVPNLIFLWCHENQLKNINLSPVPNLENLSCAENQLTELDIRSLHRLEKLSFGSVRLIQRSDQKF